MDARLTVGKDEMAQIHRGADAPTVAQMASSFVAEAIARSIASTGACRLALAGGSTPRAAYERLAGGHLPGKIDWTAVSVFFGDERMVHSDDPSSNYRMARESLLDRIPIPHENIHRIEGELPASVAALRYTGTLGVSPLDLVLLGMGEDGHVVSLFPGSADLASPASVLPTRAPVAPHERVTIGLSVINAARTVLFLVTGPGKASRVLEVFTERREGRSALPAALVAPKNGELHWILDEAAAALLGTVSPSNVEVEDHQEQAS